MGYNHNISYGNRNFSLAKYYFIVLFNKLFYSILIALAITLMVISHKNKELDFYIRENIIIITRPVVRILEYPVNIFAKTVLEIRDFVFAKRDNEILKEKNRDLEILYRGSLNIKNENLNLQKILNFVEENSFYNYKSSKIYYTSRNSVINKIIIRAGGRDNLVENSLVLGDEGSVLGRIVNVGKNISDVLLLIDINSKIPVVILGEKRTKGILTGNGSSQPKILYLEKNHNIKKDDLVYTSGDNDLIIPGLYIGKVNKVKEEEIKIKLHQNIKKIDNVLILEINQKTKNSDEEIKLEE